MIQQSLPQARLERFEREAGTLAQLDHLNLAGIHAVEETDGAKYWSWSSSAVPRLPG